MIKVHIFLVFELYSPYNCIHLFMLGVFENMVMQ